MADGRVDAPSIGGIFEVTGQHLVYLSRPGEVANVAVGSKYLLIFTIEVSSLNDC